MSSTTVTKTSETTKTPAIASTMTGHRRFDRDPAPVCSGIGTVGWSAVEPEASDSIDPVAWAAVVAVSSWRADSEAGSERVTPAVFVPPSRRSSFELSGTRTTTCLTA
jgi:hypothetical protein